MEYLKRDHRDVFSQSNPEGRGKGQNVKRVSQTKKDTLALRNRVKERVTRILNNKRVKRQKNILLC